MVITYFGKQFFKVQVGDTTLAFNPPGETSKFKGPRFGADVALTTVAHEDYNGVMQVSFGAKEPFVVRGPGEYEVKEAVIRGIATSVTIDKEPLVNTVYSVVFDDINLVFLGPLQSDSFPPKLREGIETPDILFVPIGGESTLSFDEAYKIATELEARIIIPMDYDQDAGALKKFLKEAGEEIKPLDKLTIRKKEIEGKEGEIVVLAPAA